MPRRIPSEAPGHRSPLSDAPAFDLSPLAVIVAQYDGSGGDLMAILKRTQDHYGYLPQPVVEEMARLTGLAASRIYGVITFYEPFSMVPPARHTVRVCQGTACHVRGGDEVLRAAKESLGIAAGEQTPDGDIALETVACLGACSFGPLATVDGRYLPYADEEEIPSAIARLRIAAET